MEQNKINCNITDVYICNEDTCLKTSFILIKNINKFVILRTPFLNIIKPFQVNDYGITSNILGKSLEFKFIDNEFYKDLDLVKSLSINQVRSK